MRGVIGAIATIIGSLILLSFWLGHFVNPWFGGREFRGVANVGPILLILGLALLAPRLSNNGDWVDMKPIPVYLTVLFLASLAIFAGINGVRSQQWVGRIVAYGPLAQAFGVVTILLGLGIVAWVVWSWFWYGN